MSNLHVDMQRNAYGFGMDWTLVMHDGTRYWLGQDAKVCSRALGARPNEVIQALSDRTGLDYETCRDVQYNEEVNQALAELIYDAYFGEIADPESIDLEPWSLAVE